MSPGYTAIKAIQLAFELRDVLLTCVTEANGTMLCCLWKGFAFRFDKRDCGYSTPLYGGRQSSMNKTPSTLVCVSQRIGCYFVRMMSDGTLELRLNRKMHS